MCDFEKRYKRLINRQNKLNNELKKLREDAANGDCKHGMVFEYTEDVDNGYGRWWTVTHKKCEICQKEIK